MQALHFLALDPDSETTTDPNSGLDYVASHRKMSCANMPPIKRALSAFSAHQLLLALLERVRRGDHQKILRPQSSHHPSR